VGNGGGVLAMVPLGHADSAQDFGLANIEQPPGDQQAVSLRWLDKNNDLPRNMMKNSAEPASGALNTQ